jgi:hypothetical protein
MAARFELCQKKHDDEQEKEAGYNNYTSAVAKQLHSC